MLQNRVDPYGNIIKTKARGAWMGNRGVLHNSQQQIVSPFKLKAWITCKLEFKGRRREVMSPNRYTELFFMDEATSFAAGHRPCFECRRGDYPKFKTFWLKGNPQYHFDEKTSINEIDKILHQERIDRSKRKVTYEEDAKELPDGSFVSIGGTPHLIYEHKIYLWSPFGYDKAVDLPHRNKLIVLTPESVVNTFRAGYVPQIALV
jgi:hypothetical protein